MISGNIHIYKHTYLHIHIQKHTDTYTFKKTHTHITPTKKFYYSFQEYLKAYIQGIP